MTLDPEQLDAHLAEYVDGTLADDALRDVEAHLAADPALRARVEHMSADSDALRALPRVNAPADLSEDLRGRLERDLLLGDGAAAGPGRRWLSPPVATLAAMLMVGLGLGGATYWLLSNRPSPFVDIARTTPAISEDDVATTGTIAGAKVLAGPPVDPAAARRREVTGGSTDAQRRFADEAGRAGTTAAKNEAGPELARAGRQEPPKIQTSDEPLPPELAARLSGQSIDMRRRSIVFVVDEAGSAAEFLVERQNDGTFSREAVAGIANAGDEARGAPGTSPRDTTRDNAMSPSAVAQAIAGAGSGGGGYATREDVKVSRGLSEEDAAALQARLREQAGGAGVTAYAAPAARSDVVAEAAEAATAFPDATTRRAVARSDAIAPAADSAAPAPAVAKTAPATTAPATSNAASTGPTTAPSRLTRGERLRITIVDPDAADFRFVHEVAVGDDGRIALPGLDGVDAVDRHADALRTAIAEAYRTAGLIRRPVVRVESLDNGLAAGDLPPARPQGQFEQQQGEDRGQQLSQVRVQSPAPAEASDGLVDVFVVVRAKPVAATRPATLPSTVPAE